MATHGKPSHCNDFTIAIICALKDEADAVEGMFDEFWDDNELFKKKPGDPNSYSMGRIGRHNVVLAFMPRMGKATSSGVAASLRSTFNGIKLGLVVGICGGVPRMEGDEREEMLLGDVVISTALIQYDFGHQSANEFQQKNTIEDNLGRPITEIASFNNKMQGIRSKGELKDKTLTHLGALLSKTDYSQWIYPGASKDRLYPPTYRHKHQRPELCTICEKCKSQEDEVCKEALDSICSKLMCDTKMEVIRKRLPRPESYAPQKEPQEKPQIMCDTNMQFIPKRSGSPESYVSQKEPQEKSEKEHMLDIHFGRIASGDTVMKSGVHRDKWAKSANVIAFEMEGAGVWDNFPTVVIKGVCDYADSHKNKEWQKYAAASAAACTKAYLGLWIGTEGPQQHVGALG
jgi:nucleoside phosphorylase